jgi:hypothetical protein
MKPALIGQLKSCFACKLSPRVLATPRFVIPVSFPELACNELASALINCAESFGVFWGVKFYPKQTLQVSHHAHNTYLVTAASV